MRRLSHLSQLHGMYRKLFSALLLLCSLTGMAQNAIENVVVEVYYVSDANDASDETGGGLPTGSKTYRVYIDLCDGCSLRAVYGDDNHEIKITSTEPFFNHADRGRTFGHLVQNGALDEGTTAVDSWLAMGAASNQKRGVLKVDDTDGSIVGGSNNDGGSALVPGGLLVNADAAAGVPLVERDGLVALAAGGTAAPPNFNVAGDDPATVFDNTTVSGSFTSFNMRMACSVPGVVGATDENRVLVAQLTTLGELSFCLNVEIQLPNGTVAKFVCSDDVLLPDETANGLLAYPPQCGCTDPDFLEYDPTAGCDDGSCLTAIVFGCLDSLACNYDPTANFNVSQLCCYGPTNCNGLDVSLVCPTVGVHDQDSDLVQITARPNPFSDAVFIDFGQPAAGAIGYVLVDRTGRTIRSGGVVLSGQEGWTLGLADIATGVYFLRVEERNAVRSVVIVKD
ncbi:MAG: T9SS type A sorting domain-containing protein [Flavobacteriales bacterium]|nr:T9SS type A sorting domain-containing protein [Flavobacteriales bacterium]